METFQKKLEDLLDSKDTIRIALYTSVATGSLYTSCDYVRWTGDNECKYHLPIEHLSLEDAFKFIIAYIDEKKNADSRISE